MEAVKTDLRDLTYEETRALAETLGVERYRAEQIFRWVHHRAVDAVEEMTDLGKGLRLTLAEQTTVGKLAIDLEQVSVDGTRKLRLACRDGRMIETVLIPREGGETEESEPDAVDEAPEHLQDPLFPKRPKLTQCISSQVGCALDCTFCATAQLGFGRQLTAGEIVDQVYRATHLVRGLSEEDPTRRGGGDRITNLVFMGMGEPLHNYANVMRAVNILTHPMGADFSRRRITISTAGLVPGIEKLADEPVQVNLAVSLNATTDEVRDEIMPINRKWKIAELLAAVRRLPLERRRRVTFEYVLLGGVNDTRADAARLAKLVAGIPTKINLIAWNAHEGAPYCRPTDECVRAFQDELKTHGLPVYVRRSRGRDIDAACGQLAAKAAGAKVTAAEAAGASSAHHLLVPLRT